MIVVIDFETTGFTAGVDEVLQVSIIDENEQVLLNTYCKPINTKRWDEAERVHGITPLMVANELPFEDYVPKVLEILSGADYIIAYNARFEDSFLNAYGIKIAWDKWIDPMEIFANCIYHEHSPHGGYKWQKLSTCASYYMYSFNAHDSLEDVKATLYCYKEMRKQIISKLPPIGREESGE